MIGTALAKKFIWVFCYIVMKTLHDLLGQPNNGGFQWLSVGGLRELNRVPSMEDAKPRLTCVFLPPHRARGP